jgi:hypothetical protein
MKLKKPRWMNANDWCQYQDQRDDFNNRLLPLLRRELAEAHADRDNPDLRREHSGRLRILECQIADASGTAHDQELPRPIVVIAALTL